MKLLNNNTIVLQYWFSNENVYNYNMIISHFMIMPPCNSFYHTIFYITT